MAGCCRSSGPPATIAGLIEAGDNVTVTGSGTAADPYIISSAAEGIPPAITGLISAGTNVVLSGTGTTADPYVVVANATNLVTAGANITRTGAGTVASPYVFAAVPTAANLVTAGSNVTRTGAGTAASPYVFASNVTGLVTAGTNVTITGVGTVASPYVVASTLPARGAPVALTITAPTTGAANVRRNPDTSMTLDGGVIITGAVAAGVDTPVATLPAGYMPGVATDLAGVGIGSATGNPIAVRVVVEPGGTVTVRTPAIAGGDTLTVSLDSLTYWPT
jgi:hypothetical protein